MVALQRWATRFSLLTLLLLRDARQIHRLSVRPHHPDLCLQRPTRAKHRVSKLRWLHRRDRQTAHYPCLLPPFCAALVKPVSAGRWARPCALRCWREDTQDWAEEGVKDSTEPMRGLASPTSRSGNKVSFRVSTVTPRDLGLTPFTDEGLDAACSRNGVALGKVADPDHSPECARSLESGQRLFMHPQNVYIQRLKATISLHP